MLRIVVPIIIAGFIGLVIVLAIGLQRDPRLVPSPFIGKPLPTFSLPSLHDTTQTVSSDVFKGQISLLNVWASWCVSCRVEHPFLIELAKQQALPVYGLNYKDKREDAIRWLKQLGDPYAVIAFDELGRIGIDLGVYGAPETFLIDKNGIVTYKHIGPVTPEVWEKTFVPLILELQKSTI